MIIVNMTVWTSVAALKDFAYRTDHAEFLARRREWFVAGSTGVVLWWIRAGDLPTVDDAKRRLEFLDGTAPRRTRSGSHARRHRSSSSAPRSRIPTRVDLIARPE